jgi:hypothetical protein
MFNKIMAENFPILKKENPLRYTKQPWSKQNLSAVYYSQNN